MSNKIRIQLENSALHPGATLSGSASWQLDEPPRYIFIRLFWYTAGKGTEDIEIIDEIKLEGSASDVRAFSFNLPPEPYSFSGQIISLQWAVEVVAGKHAEQALFVMAPDGVPRVLMAPDGVPPEF